MRYVVGHKKPDTDAVLSAIALSEILKIEGKNFEPIVTCEPTKETKYILKKLNLPVPNIMSTITPKVKDNIDNEFPAIQRYDELYKAILLMRDLKVTKLPVVDETNHFIGVLDYYGIAEFILEHIPAYDISNHNVNEFIVKEDPITENEYLSKYMENIEPNLIKFVVDENGKYVGALTNQKLLNPNKYEVYLVDHNELSQAVDGIEYAKIIGVFDHHKFALKTDEPIDIRVRPLGSTCSVIYEYALEKRYKLPRKLKEILLYGIIADTMGFRLITTTEKDKEFVKKLANELNIDYKEIDKEIIKAATDISGISLEKLLFQDFKEFNYGAIKVGIGVITLAELSQIEDKLTEIKEILQKTKDNNGYHLLMIMICEVLNNKTTIMGYGDNLEALAKHFGKELKDNLFEVGWILSRKKEIVPVISKYFS